MKILLGHGGALGWRALSLARASILLIIYFFSFSSALLTAQPEKTIVELYSIQKCKLEGKQQEEALLALKRAVPDSGALVLFGADESAGSEKSFHQAITIPNIERDGDKLAPLIKATGKPMSIIVGSEVNMGKTKWSQSWGSCFSKPDILQTLLHQNEPTKSNQDEDKEQLEARTQLEAARFTLLQKNRYNIMYLDSKKYFLKPLLTLSIKRTQVERVLSTLKAALKSKLVSLIQRRFVLFKALSDSIHARISLFNDQIPPSILDHKREVPFLKVWTGKILPEDLCREILNQINDGSTQQTNEDSFRGILNNSTVEKISDMLKIRWSKEYGLDLDEIEIQAADISVHQVPPAPGAAASPPPPPKRLGGGRVLAAAVALEDPGESLVELELPCLNGALAMGSKGNGVLFSGMRLHRIGISFKEFENGGSNKNGISASISNLQRAANPWVLRVSAKVCSPALRPDLPFWGEWEQEDSHLAGDNISNKGTATWTGETATKVKERRGPLWWNLWGGATNTRRGAMQPLLEDAAVLGRCAAFDAAMDAPYFEKDFGDPSQIIGITDLKFSIRRWPPWNDQVRVAARARRGGAGVGNCLAVLQRRTGAAMDRAVSRAFPERPRARGARAAPMLSVFVEPAFRGAPAGVGALLMRRLLRHLRRRGYQYMVVTIDDDGSGRLYRWYEKLGFRYLELPGAEEEGGRLMIVEVENDLEGPVKHEPVRKLES